MVARCAPADKYFRDRRAVRAAEDVDRQRSARVAVQDRPDGGFSRDSLTVPQGTGDGARHHRDQELGEKEFGVSSTPTFFVNGKQIQGVQPEDYRKAIEARSPHRRPLPKQGGMPHP